MNREEIIQQLKTHHQVFVEYILGLSEKDFSRNIEGKWTAAQQFEHIHLSTKPLKFALKLPAWFLKLYIGKANRASKSYEELVAKYKLKLEQGGRAGKAFIPKGINAQERQDLSNKLNKTIESICKSLSKYSENELDILILPHPLLGKLTMREMMYFTILHVQHHQYHTQENLKK
ncbi:MAG: DinB family protein [Saprospiraceae bacterium]|nr:DinB family protein [Saprospiraceae bacterium]